MCCTDHEYMTTIEEIRASRADSVAEEPQTAQTPPWNLDRRLEWIDPIFSAMSDL